MKNKKQDCVCIDNPNQSRTAQHQQAGKTSAQTQHAHFRAYNTLFFLCFAIFYV